MMATGVTYQWMTMTLRMAIHQYQVTVCLHW